MRNNKLNELDSLYAELAEVEASGETYLPKYGYAAKDEIIMLIREDIAETEREMEEESYGYTDEELEEERMQLCSSQGLARWC